MKELTSHLTILMNSPQHLFYYTIFWKGEYDLGFTISYKIIL